MKTKHLLPLFAAIMVSFSLQAQTNDNVLNASDTPETQMLAQPFSEIVISGNFNVILSQGMTNQYKVDADTYLVSLISPVIKKNVLTIQMDKKATKEMKNRANKINVYITVVNLEKLTISDDCTIDPQTAFNCKDLTIRMKLSTLKPMNLVAKKLVLQLDKASKAEISAQVSSIRGAIKSSSNIAINGVSISSLDLLIDASTIALNGRISGCELNLKGASKAQASLTSDKINATLSGSSTITLEGTASSEKFSAKGGSTIHAEKMLVGDATVSLAGSSTATITSRKTLNADLAGSSRISYVENGQKKEITSAGKFKFKF